MGIGNKVANNRSVGTGAALRYSSPPPARTPPAGEGPAGPGAQASRSGPGPSSESGHPLPSASPHTMGGNVLREPQLLPGHAGGRLPFVGEEREERQSSDILLAATA